MKIFNLIKTENLKKQEFSKEMEIVKENKPLIENRIASSEGTHVHIPFFNDGNPSHQRFLSRLKETNPGLYERMANWE